MLKTLISIKENEGLTCKLMVTEKGIVCQQLNLEYRSGKLSDSLPLHY